MFDERSISAGSRAGAVIVLALGLVRCATGSGGGGSERAATGSSPIVDPPVKAGAPTLFVAMPSSPNFIAVRSGLVVEVRKTFNVTTFVVTGNTRDEDLADALTRANPICVVLMDNATMDLYRRYEGGHPGAKRLPTVVVMALFLEEVRSQLRSATGIAYEVPGVTAFIQLRSVINPPVDRVGVLYRPVFQGFIERQKVLAAKEHVELIGVSVATDVGSSSLRDTLHTMVTTGRIDAVWILNDNALLRDASFVNDVWRAELVESRVPVIVGVPNLVNPDSPLGTLAVVPDHEGLGLQTANLIFDLSESGWDAAGHPIEPPVSVKTIVDVRSARSAFGLRADALRRIDKALE